MAARCSVRARRRRLAGDGIPLFTRLKCERRTVSDDDEGHVGCRVRKGWLMVRGRNCWAGSAFFGLFKCVLDFRGMVFMLCDGYENMVGVCDAFVSL